MADDAVRAVALDAYCASMNAQQRSMFAGTLSRDEFREVLLKHVDAILSAYRAHTLAGAGEVEKWLRNYAKQRNAQASLLNASDLIAAQRERIAELEKVLVPFAKNSDLAGNASDELIVGLLANGIADAITVRDLRRARAALGREG